MIRAAIVGMGLWGQHLVASVQGKSDLLRFVAGTTRTPAKSAEFAGKHDIRMVERYEDILSDPTIEAVVFATPHSMYTGRDKTINPAANLVPRTEALEPDTGGSSEMCVCDFPLSTLC